LIPPLAGTLGACGSGVIPLGLESSADNGVRCQAAGGSCHSAGDDLFCVRAASSVDDCNAQLTPNGSFCCLVAAFDAGREACAPISCPRGVPWDPATCECAVVATDAGQEACAPIPCPQGAAWEPMACECIVLADAGQEACAPVSCPPSSTWDASACACAP
jgi:hypothetical protein